MTAIRRLPGAPGGPVSPASPIPLSPLSPFGPWGPTDTKQVCVYHDKKSFVYQTKVPEKPYLAFLGFQGDLVYQDAQAVQVYQGAQEILVLRLFLVLQDDLEMPPSLLASACETCSRPSSLQIKTIP